MHAVADLWETTGPGIIQVGHCKAWKKAKWARGGEARTLNVEDGEADSCFERCAVIVTMTAPGEVGQRAWQGMGLHARQKEANKKETLHDS